MRTHEELVIAADSPDAGEVDLPLRHGRGKEEIESSNVTKPDLLLLLLGKGGQQLDKKTRTLGGMEEEKIGNTQTYGVTVFLHQKSSEALHLHLPVIVFLRCHLGEIAKGRFDLRIHGGKEG